MAGNVTANLLSQLAKPALTRMGSINSAPRAGMMPVLNASGTGIDWVPSDYSSTGSTAPVAGKTSAIGAASSGYENMTDAEILADLQGIRGANEAILSAQNKLGPIDLNAPQISNPQQYAQDFVTATTTGNPLDWGREAIYYTDPTSQALQAVGQPGAAGAYTNTANTLGELYSLYAAGNALAGGGEGAAATGGGAATGATALPETGMIGTGATSAADATLGGVGASTGGAGTGYGAAVGGAALGGASSLGGGGDSGSINPNTLGALIQGGTALIAGQQGVNAAQDATEELRRQFDIGQENMAPWLQAGTAALGAQQELMGLGPNGPEAQLSSLMSSPGYQFRLGQGQRSLEASSAARGGMGSGKAGTAMTQFGQDYASNEYGNRLNQLAGLSGTGQSQSQYGAGLGMGYAGEIGNAALAGANARQSGILGAGSALSNWMNPQPQQLTLADYMRSR